MNANRLFRAAPFALLWPVFAAAALIGCSSTSESAPAAKEPVPGLAVGDKAPNAALTTVDGKTVHLASLYADGPVIVTFYRGGWCPFCNRALSEWQGMMDEVKGAGATFVAITPESPANAAGTIEKDHLSYVVLSDTDQSAARAYKVYFMVDDQTRAKYKGYGIDLEKSNASGTWELPAPGTFVIDRAGVVRYAFADWDYKKRADPDEVMAAVRALNGG